ncbi:MAG TPA: hypothetical protein VGF59_13300, partial [Bryobacteraceae bacterium]|jgi:hypothetical protein
MRILSLFLLTAILAGAADRGSWDVVGSLPAGATIRVTDKADMQQKGTFVSAAADAIVLTTKSGQVRVDRINVRKIEAKPGHRVRNALIGAGIGLAVGVVIDQTAGQYFRNEAHETDAARALTVLAPVGIFGGIASLTGAYRTVYSAQ